MLHLNHIDEECSTVVADGFIKKASGRYYTGELVGRRLARVIAQAFFDANPHPIAISVLDPFGGDARLVEWLVDAWLEQGFPAVHWHVEIWDRDSVGFDVAQGRLDRKTNIGASITVNYRVVDSFQEAVEHPKKFDIVVTNPPWELLKPDRRELEKLPPELRDEYVSKMREYDAWLRCQYPRSQPKTKFAGWGTNLSRVGLEVSLQMARLGGIVGAVLPASILADSQSGDMRQYLLTKLCVVDIAYYPAEAKLYDSADVESITVVAATDSPPSSQVAIWSYCVASDSAESVSIELNEVSLSKVDFVLPVSFGAKAVEILAYLTSSLPRWGDLEDAPVGGLWAGREIDETGSASWLVPLPSAEGAFVKGRMIERYKLREEPKFVVARDGWISPTSVAFARIVWRDVSRPSQKRRVFATLIPAGWVAGNSLGVAYFRDGNPTALTAFLGVMNSTAFEFQLRAHLATGHVSLSSLRKVAVPTLAALRDDFLLAELVATALSGEEAAEFAVDAYVARRVYLLDEGQYRTILSLFPKITPSERDRYLEAFLNFAKPTNNSNHFNAGNMGASEVIYNHNTARLSVLDMQMVLAVPEGGNWKDIPESIPSKRLDQIRESFKRGEGSRSTYYGRLRRDRPSYTINTYFNRPGNGCHMHYSQDRVLSQREAARLQSFPDSFEFLGAQGSICTQIGNAVPPLLAFQIARSLGKKGLFIDLFSGAGGMGLGFKWAGWSPVVANDIVPGYLATYARNVHHKIEAGSITEPDIFDRLVTACEMARVEEIPLWVLGGPPCQGFSTAGNRRSMEDDRNHLAWDYVRFLERVKPDGFVFENVTGLLNMQGGKIFEAVKEAFSSVMPSISGAVLATQDYAVPQRRKRVILVGCSDKNFVWAPPEPITSLEYKPSLFSPIHPAVSVEEALDDLPPLFAGEEGGSKGYLMPPRTVYQALMRGLISPDEYLAFVTEGKRLWQKP